MASSLYYIKTPLSGAACVFGCLDDVWKESENVWGCISTKSVCKQIISGKTLRYCLLFRCPVLHRKAIAWGCLDCVWGCLDGVWVSGDVLIPNLLVKIYKTFASSDIACSSSALLCIKTPMSGRCLDGVCGCLDHTWRCLADVCRSLDVI